MTTPSVKSNGRLLRVEAPLPHPTRTRPGEYSANNSGYEADLLARFPWLAKPGPQPWNCAVAPTMREQCARVFRPREPAELEREVEERMRAIIREELAEFTRQLPG